MAERPERVGERSARGVDSGERVLLLVSGDRDRDLLADRLSDHHEVVVGSPGAEWDRDRFDLCVVDATTYRRVAADLAARKREAATYLPVLLLVPDRDRADRAEWIAEELGGTVDDVLVVPAPQYEFDARVESLLRARRRGRKLALYRRVMDEATLGITIADPTRPDTPVVYANEQFLELTGYDRESILGRNWRLLRGPDTDEAAARELAAAVDVAEPATVEFLAYRADGTEFWNRMTVAPVRNEEGTVTHLLGFHRDVTEREALAAELRTETKLLERVFDTSPVGITVIDPKGTIVRANETAEEELGLERSEILSRTYDDADWEIIDADGEPIPAEELPFARVLATGEPVEDYRHGIRVDGEERWLSVNAAPLTDGDGDLEGVVASIQDITDRLERERELERAVDLLERTQELADVGGWEIDLETEELRWTDQVRRIRDLPLDHEPDLEAAIDFYHPDDRPIIREAIERAIEHGEPYDLELRNETAEGDRLWVRTLGERHEKDGRTVLRGTIQDITERKERERELERYETIVQTTSEPIYVLDADGRFARVNDALVEASGYTREELLGSHVSMVADEPDVERAEELVRELVEGGGDRATIEASLVAADGTRRRYAVSMSVLREDGEFAGTVAVAHDVTDLREHQRRLSVLDRVLRHNLRNKMNLVLGHAEALASSSDPAAAEAAGVIRRAAADLLDLSESARQFHSVVGDDADGTKTVDVTASVTDVVAAARLEHPDADLSTSLPEEAHARVHETFGLALEELVENAIAHSDRAHPSVDVSVDVEADAVAVRVADDGPGLDDVDRAALLRGTESPLEHTQGLGLWLVRWSAESAGGGFDIAENDPRGTVVTVELPRPTG